MRWWKVYRVRLTRISEMGPCFNGDKWLEAVRPSTLHSTARTPHRSGRSPRRKGRRNIQGATRDQTACYHQTVYFGDHSESPERRRIPAGKHARARQPKLVWGEVSR